MMYLLLFLPYTKTVKCDGEFEEIFPTYDITCPCKALRRLMSVQIEKNVFDVQKPVFTFASGKHLTVKHFNQVLKDLLAHIYRPGEDQIIVHSFRAGLPSLPNVFTEHDIQQQGRWRSDCYRLYLRLKRNNRRELFEKIRMHLHNDVK
jgi:hypothetical protein